MEPTDILSNEHRVIEVVLASLERLVQDAEAHGCLEREPAGQALEFIKSFADRCHHYKEEKLLFPSLIEKGMPSEGGPVAIMVYEHRQGRACVAGMRSHLEGAAEGDPEALAAFAEHARAYVELLRQHIRKEDNVLFPVTIKIMSAPERAELGRAFAAIESYPEAGKDHGNCMRLAEHLADRYGINKDALGRISCACNRS